MYKDEGQTEHERGNKNRNIAGCSEDKYTLNWGKIILHFLPFALD